MPRSSILLFQRLRWRLLCNNFRVVLRGSPVRVLTIFFASLLIWAGVYTTSAFGFLFIQEHQIPFAGGIVATLFDFLFLSLAVMLIFSTGIILYSSLFSAAETNFLLSTPAAADQVFAYKYQGAVAFSSWAFLLLGAPVLIAYGVIFAVPWYFYALLPAFFFGFVLLPGSIGALLCLLLVNFVPRRRKQVLAVVIVLILAVVGIWAYRLMMASLRPESWNRDFVQQMVGQFSFAQGPLVPTRWMTLGVEAAARGDLAEAGYRLALVWSNGLFFYLLTAWAAVRLYRRGYNRLAGGGYSRASGVRPAVAAWVDRALARVLPFLDPQTRLLIVKDFRTFRRDPAQWAQILIFSGLLVLYFANTRRFYQEEIGRAYQNGISLLNLASTGLLMCAYTGRFIFPMLSLEGRKFWILGLLPLQRDRLLWGKFAFSLTGALLIAEFLVLFSDIAIGMPPTVLGLHALTVAVLAVGLSGLSVGLGAWMPNFRESDPSKIAVGFGGTLNLVASLLLLVVVIGLMAAPWHLAATFRAALDLAEIGVDGWIVAGVVLGTAVGLTAAVVPLRIGCRMLRKMEF
jgi:ABC-2 type transport system permease protein